MTRSIALAAVVAALSLSSSLAFAGPVETACNRSDRQAANRALCSCIGQVAEQTLRRTDQKRAASFFKDPDRAQQVKMSQRDADDAFWDRYKIFGEQAELYCAN